MAGAGEGAALRKDIDVRIDGNDLRHRLVLVLLVRPLVIRLDRPALLGADELVQDVRVIEKPASAADSDQQKEDAGWKQTRCALPCDLPTRGPALFRAAPGQRNRKNREDTHKRKPVDRGPEERLNEVAIPVHVRVSDGRGVADEVQRVLPAKALQDRCEYKDDDDNAYTDELVGHHRLNEHG